MLVAPDERWRSAATPASISADVRISFIGVSTDVLLDLVEKVCAAYGFNHDGASLIRPDGYIAWRLTGLPSHAAPLLSWCARSGLRVRAPSPDTADIVLSHVLKCAAAAASVATSACPQEGVPEK
jgi:putative polyketide hydroxylase